MLLDKTKKIITEIHKKIQKMKENPRKNGKKIQYTIS